MPVRASDYSFRKAQKATRIGKPRADFDVVELCKRLEEIRGQQRAAAWSGRLKAAGELRAPTKTIEPYHYVPQTAAKDFTRTTAPASARPGHPHRQSESRSLSHPGNRGDTSDRRKLEKRQSLGASRELAEFERKHYSRMSIASMQPAILLERPLNSDHGQWRKSPISKDDSAPRPEARSKHVDNQSDHVYQSLLEADDGFRLLNMGDIDHADLEGAGLESRLSQDAPILAHKITRQHLEDRTNWAQSDASEGEGKHLLKDFLAPLIRATISKRSLGRNSTALCSGVIQEKVGRKDAPGREFSFLPRQFTRS